MGNGIRSALRKWDPILGYRLLHIKISNLTKTLVFRRLDIVLVTEGVPVYVLINIVYLFSQANKYEANEKCIGNVQSLLEYALQLLKFVGEHSRSILLELSSL